MEERCYGNVGNFAGREEMECGDKCENREEINDDSLEGLASNSPFLTVEEEAEITGGINTRPSLEAELDTAVVSVSNASPKCPKSARRSSVEPYFSLHDGDVLEGMTVYTCRHYLLPGALLL